LVKVFNEFGDQWLNLYFLDFLYFDDLLYLLSWGLLLLLLGLSWLLLFLLFL